MAVNLANADSALKSVYLDAISEQLNNNVNPFLAMIEKTSEDVWGKEIRKLAIHGINGGIGAGTEDGILPSATGNNYSQFVSTLKNLYGVIEISDKAIRASENNTGAFVSLLNAEMEGLIKSSKFNLGRMLFGDGSGNISGVSAVLSDGRINLFENAGLIEGMLIDFYNSDGQLIEGYEARRVRSVTLGGLAITIDGETPTDVIKNGYVTVHGSKGNEITGLQAIFDTTSESLYGLKRSENQWMKPIITDVMGDINEDVLQKTLDLVEQNSGTPVNVIMCSLGMRREIYKMLREKNHMVNSVELAGGYKAMTYNGIPIVADRFCPKYTVYLLNSNDFALHQLCDWQWLTGDDGKVLKQVAGKPVYTATLVKYAELICARPYAQGALINLNED